MKETVVITSGCVRCGGASGAEVIQGDTVKLWLDQTAISGFPQWVAAVVVIILPGDVTVDYTYEYETDDLEDAALKLRSCDILSVTCAGCCAILQDQIDAIGRTRILDTTFTLSSLTVALEDGEFVVSAIQTTGGSGVSLESVVQTGSSAVFQFSAAPNAETGLRIQIRQT